MLTDVDVEWTKSSTMSRRGELKWQSQVGIVLDETPFEKFCFLHKHNRCLSLDWPEYFIK